MIANINKLTGILGLSWAEQEFLYEMDAMQDNTLTLDLISYLEENPSGLPLSTILKATKKHIELMGANGAYKNFVVNYMGGHSSSLWWENVSFLEIASNVDMIVNGPTDYFEALGFYDDEGHSDPGESTQPPTYTDPFWHLENPLELGGFNNNVAIFFEFANRNEPIHLALTEALRGAIIDVNDNIPFPLAPIRQLHISSTSEGPSITTHATYSNHYNGTALDISRINRVVIRLLPTNHPWVKNLQLAFEQDINRHENLGPYMLHRQGVYHYVSNHRGHIHFSVRP